MADVLKEKDEDDDIIIVEEKPSNTPPKSKDEDDRDDDHDDDHDERSKADDDDDGDDDDRAAIRERRRLEKKERRERREAAMRRDKIELDFLRKRNEDVERRLMRVETTSHQAEISTIDAQIAAARQRASLAEQVFAKAVEAQNGEDAAKAMSYRDQATALVSQLENHKAAQLRQQAARQQREQPPQGGHELPETVQRLAQKFMADNDWYDPKGGDEDSAIVMAIDATLTREGLDPSTPGYWKELKKRAARRLPERFQSEAGGRGDRDDDDRGDERGGRGEQRRQPAGGPQLGSGREGRNTSGRREVYVSPERKQAMIDAGVWDDPILRARYVKRYEQYDKENRNRR